MSSFTPDRNTMLTDDIRKVTLRIAAPSLTAMLSTGLCTLLDALCLAHETAAVSSAVSVCFPLLTAQQTIGFTLGMGAGSHVSRSIGEGNQESACQASATALAAALALGLSLLPCLAFLPSLLSLLGATAENMKYAAEYARLLLCASPFTCLGLVLSSLLRAQGKTPANMRAYVISSIAGALLTYTLISQMHLGALGAGISLFIREILAFLLLCTSFLRSKDILRPTIHDVTLKPWIASAILRSGLPTLLRQGTSSLSGVLLSRICRRFGTAILSGMGLAVRAGALITSAAIGFGQGFTPVCGVNYGAGKTDRVQAAYRFCMKLLVASLLAIGLLTFCFAEKLLALFQAEAEVAHFAVRVLRAQSVVFICQGAVILMNMLTQAMGLPIRASLVATSRQGIFFIPLLFILPRYFGETGLILCQSAADILAMGFSFLITRGVDRSKPTD